MQETERQGRGLGPRYFGLSRNRRIARTYENILLSIDRMHADVLQRLIIDVRYAGIEFESNNCPDNVDRRHLEIADRYVWVLSGE